MEQKVRLLHLDLFQDPDTTVQNIMDTVLEFGKVPRLFRPFLFYKYFHRATKIINEVQGIEISELELNPNLTIKYPTNIDSIPYRAMLEIRSLKDNENDMGYQNYISEIICKACYSSNFGSDYDSDNHLYKKLRERILNLSLIDALSILNHINSEINRSERFWEERFFAVNVPDKDFDNAGGQRMGQFNVITTLKGICSDFNIPINKAWQVPYSFVQTNNLAKATYSHIENRMREIKEDRMRRERGRKH